MKLGTVLVLVLLCSVILADEPEQQQKEETNVFESELFTGLDDTSFTDFINSNKLVLVKFYAPWYIYTHSIFLNFLFFNYDKSIKIFIQNSL